MTKVNFGNSLRWTRFKWV